MNSNTLPKKLRRLAGGMAIGLGLGTVALGVAILNHPAVTVQFAGATSLIGLFCMALGRTVILDREAEAAEAAAKLENAEAAA